MSVNAATINQQILNQQFVTQQTAEQTSSAQPENAATTWQPAGMPPNLSGQQPVNYAGQELYLYVDAIANSPTGVLTPDQTVGLAYFINQFVTACKNDGYQYSDTQPISPTQKLFNDLTNTPYPVIIGGQTENESLETLSQQILKGGVSGYQSLIAMQNLFHNGLGQGPDGWSPTYQLEVDLNSWETANPGSSLGEMWDNAYTNNQTSDLQTLYNLWTNVPSTLSSTSQLEQLAQAIINVSNDISSMQSDSPTGYISPAFQLLYYAFNAPIYDGTSMVTLSNNLLNAQTALNNASPTDPDYQTLVNNLNNASNIFSNAYQTENGYIGQFVKEAYNPSNYGPIPT